MFGLIVTLICISLAASLLWGIFNFFGDLRRSARHRRVNAKNAALIAANRNKLARPKVSITK